MMATIMLGTVMLGTITPDTSIQKDMQYRSEPRRTLDAARSSRVMEMSQMNTPRAVENEIAEVSSDAQRDLG